MVTRSRSSFRGKVSKDAQKQTGGASYGYLRLPKGVNVFSAEPGSKNVLLDFLPYTVTDPKHPNHDTENKIALVGDLWYKRPFRIHRNVGVENDTMVCLSSVKKPCPICEYRAKRAKEGADKEELKTMNSSLRNLYIVVPLNSKNNEAIPHVFDIAQTLFQDLLKEELDEHEEFEVFPDLEEGYTLKVRFSSEKIRTGKPYAEAKKIEFIERQEQYDESILKDVPNLDEILSILSYEELSNKFFEEEDGGKLDDVDKDDDETPKRKKTFKPSEEEDDDKPTRRESSMHRSEGKKDSNTPKCLFGYKFSVDTGHFEECDDCNVYDDCKEAKSKR